MRSPHAGKPVERREFLRRSAALGAGLLVADRAASPSAADAGEVRAALIGVGAQGETLLKAALAVPGLRLQAVCDLWKDYRLDHASRLLERNRVEHRAYADYRDLLDKEKGLDAAIVATPDFAHAEQTVACLRAGLHVYCESPMAHRIEDARTMVLAARETKRRLQIGYQRRSHPIYRHVADKLLREAKLLGRIGVANAQWNRSLYLDRGWPQSRPVDDAVLKRHGYDSMHRFRNWWWYRDLGSGPLGAFASHQLDVVDWFLGAPPAAVQAAGGTDWYERETHEWPDTVMALLDYAAAGKTVRAAVQLVSHSGDGGAIERFLGDEGSLAVSEAAGAAWASREPRAPAWDRWVNLEYVRPADPAGGAAPGSPDALRVAETSKRTRYDVPARAEVPVLQSHLQNFADAIRGKTPLACPPEAGFRALVATTKIDEAIRSATRTTIAPGEYVV
jgi:predicted dehydrogenase